VAGLDSPLGKVLSEKTLPNGLYIKKVRVPLGVVGVIYEARPNVTFDVFALCFKTGNISILKGGSDADNSNRAIMKIIHQVLSAHQHRCKYRYLAAGRTRSYRSFAKRCWLCRCIDTPR
jgi:glutamate-5-semialdehyde dehydrogenase